MKKNYLILLAVVLTFHTGLQAQTMYVRETNGTQTTYAVASIEKITFPSGNLVLASTAGADASYALSNLRYLNFNDFTLATTSNEIVKKGFYVFPNPVSAILHFGNDNPAQTISQLAIYSLEGRMLMTKDLFAGNNPQIEVNQLPAGIYFCKIMAGNQTQTIQFLKQ